MTIGLIKDPNLGVTFEDGRDLFNAIALSLLTHARAKPEDDVQDKTDLGGWWGDAYPDVPGDSFGSRLWTLHGRGTPIALELAPDMVREACQWAIDDGLITAVEPICEVVGPGVMAVSVRLSLPDGKIADVLGPWYVTT